MQKEVGGVLASYEVCGAKNKNDLVILHGWGCSLGEWRGVAQKLSQRYRILLLDLPGFGSSQKPEGYWGIYDYADWTKELLNKLGIKKTVILGHSFGGRIGIVLAAKWPGLVEKLVLVDAAGIEIKSPKAIVIGLGSPWLRWVPQEIKNWFGSQDYKKAGEMRKIFVKMVNQDLRGEFTKIGSPTVIIWGEKDSILPVWQAKMTREGIRGSVLRIVWGANHWPHLEKFEDFMKILEEELK